MELTNIPAWDSFTTYINSLEAGERKRILDYIRDSNILGNPILEEFFMVQHSSILTLSNFQKSTQIFKTEYESWISTLEPKLVESADSFFSSMAQFTAQSTADLTLLAKQLSAQAHSAGTNLERELSRFVEFGNEQLEERLKEHEATLEAKLDVLLAQLAHNADTERRRVLKGLTDVLQRTITPHVEAAFKASSKKNTLISIGRDFAIVLAALIILSVGKFLIFGLS